LLSFSVSQPIPSSLRLVSLNCPLLRTFKMLGKSFEEISELASYYANERFDELLDEIYEFRSKLSEEVDNLAVNSSVSMLEEEGENLIKLLDKLETGAEDLGVDPSELLDEYVDIRERAEEAKYLYESFKDKYLEVVRDSGTLATFLSKHKAKLNKKK
jgi:DNA repair ATPase RecN